MGLNIDLRERDEAQEQMLEVDSQQLD